MGCAIVSIILGMPRLGIFLLWWLRDGWLEQAVHPWFWLLAGWFFLPWTTLAFAYGSNSLGATGEVPPLGWVLVIVGLLLDLGVAGAKARRRAKRD